MEIFIFIMLHIIEFSTLIILSLIHYKNWLNISENSHFSILPVNFADTPVCCPYALKMIEYHLLYLSYENFDYFIFYIINQRFRTSASCTSWCRSVWQAACDGLLSLTAHTEIRKLISSAFQVYLLIIATVNCFDMYQIY